GRVGVDWAVDRAASAGSAVAVVRNSNHCGIAGWYALRAAAAGMIGLSFTNSSPLVAPTRALRPLIGTNPIALAAPAGRWGAFCWALPTSISRGAGSRSARGRGRTFPLAGP